MLADLMAFVASFLLLLLFQLSETDGGNGKIWVFTSLRTELNRISSQLANSKERPSFQLVHLRINLQTLSGDGARYMDSYWNIDRYPSQV
jgi:hypothetical protein